MKKIIALAVSAIIVIAVAGAGTYAFFSDTAKSSANQIQAGTLYLTPDTSHFFTTGSDYNNVIPGVTHDEYVTLVPAGTVTSGNYLSIDMKNLVLDKSGFLTLVGGTSIHKLDGSAYVTGDAGDLGLGTKMVCWLSTSSSNTPSGSDIILVPGKNSGGMSTFTTVFGSTTWSTIWGHANITNYNYPGYLNLSASPTSVNSTDYHWNDVFTGAMATTTYYFHLTFNFPNNATQSDNAFQGEKITNDFYFTLASSNAPY